MKKQFIQIKWKPETKEPFMILNDLETNVFELFPLNKEISIKKFDKKYCVGNYSLSSLSANPCPNHTDLTGRNQSCCDYCETLSSFRSCLMCKGYTCNSWSDKAKEFCKKDHKVYLAYFGGDRFKVGTAVFERKHERLLEQGALFSLFIAEGNGRIARTIESEIASLGISDKVNASYKMHNLIVDKSSEEVASLLLEKFEFIKNNLNKELLKYFVTPEFNDFGFINTKIKSRLTKLTDQIDLFNTDKTEFIKPEILSNNNKIEGNIISMLGSILIFEKENKVFAVNIKEFCGWEIEVKILNSQFSILNEKCKEIFVPPIEH